MSRRKDAAGQPEPMAAEGDSVNWAAAKQNQVRIGDEFLLSISDAALKARWGRSWASLSEEASTERELWARLATFVTETYIIGEGRINAGKKLEIKTALGVFSGLLNQTAARFRTSSRQETKDFLQCQAADGSEAATWLKRIKNNMARSCFQRSMVGGESQDHSANAIYLDYGDNSWERTLFFRLRAG